MKYPKAQIRQADVPGMVSKRWLSQGQPFHVSTHPNLMF